MNTRRKTAPVTKRFSKEMLSFVKEEQISLLLNIIIAYKSVRLVSIFEKNR